MLKQLNEWLEFQRTCHALNAQSDRMLADIGIKRADIPARVRGLDPADPDAGRSLIGRLAMAVARPLREHVREMSRQRRIRKELSAYRDDELTEIGISRADIPTIARACGPYAAA
jgi:uncharacterized protein YjiS (DUF1127 family)